MTRTSFLKRIPGAEEALASMRGKTKTQRAQLATAGLNHKSRKTVNAKLKAVLEEATADIQTALEKLTDDVPEGLAEGLAVTALQEVLFQDTAPDDVPTEEDLLEEELMATDEDEEDLVPEDDEDEDEVKSLRKQLARSRVEKHSKQVQFLGDLVTTQGDMAKTFGELAAALKAQSDTFDQRLKALEAQAKKTNAALSISPRSVTGNARAEALIDAATKQIESGTQTVHPFTGLPVSPEELASSSY